GVAHHTCLPRARAAAMPTRGHAGGAPLGSLPAAPRRVRLLSHVYVLPYRHPLATAKAFATLDALSGGRVIVGVGAGHLEAEFAALGGPFAGRGRRLDEAIDLLAEALTHEFPDHDGPTWTVADLGLRPRPTQQPSPPTYVL